MTISLKRQTKPQTFAGDHEAILPIGEQEDFRSISKKIEDLKRQLDEKHAHRDQLEEQRRQLRSSSFIDFLTTKYLSGASAPNEASLLEQIGLVNDQLRALSKAIALAEQERGSLRGRLSDQIQRAQFPTYRQALRQVLAGAVQIEAGNRAALRLREELERKGFAAGIFTPALLSPWPYWGSLEDPSSVWRMHLIDLFDRRIITREECAAIIDGDLSSFIP